MKKSFGHERSKTIHALDLNSLREAVSLVESSLKPTKTEPVLEAPRPVYRIQSGAYGVKQIFSSDIDDLIERFLKIHDVILISMKKPSEFADFMDKKQSSHILATYSKDLLSKLNDVPLKYKNFQIVSGYDEFTKALKVLPKNKAPLETFLKDNLTITRYILPNLGLLEEVAQAYKYEWSLTKTKPSFD